MIELVSALPIVAGVLLLVALVLQPILQKRREKALFERMRELHDADQAAGVISAELGRTKNRLPEKWWHSYRFWSR